MCSQLGEVYCSGDDGISCQALVAISGLQFLNVRPVGLMQNVVLFTGH